MRVLFPARIVDKHVGGNTTYTKALSSGLQAEGVETGIFGSGDSPLKTVFQESLAGVRAHQTNSILHYSADTGPLLPTRSPSVVTVHGVASRWIKVARTPIQEAVWRMRVRRAIASTRALVTVSNAAADDIAEVFNVEQESITVIPHGIDFAHFSTPRVLDGERWRELPEHYVLYVGNIEPRKNIVDLIRAFDVPPLSRMDIPLVIAGRPAWNYEASMRAISESKRVQYVGFVSDAERVGLMQRAQLFVFPSLYEGFGFPVLEAMASGTPVAASRNGALQEVAGPSWQLNDLRPENLSWEIAAALGSSKWLQAAPDAGRHWASQFSWRKSISAHMDVYRTTLS